MGDYYIEFILGWSPTPPIIPRVHIDSCLSWVWWTIVMAAGYHLFWGGGAGGDVTHESSWDHVLVLLWSYPRELVRTCRTIAIIGTFWQKSPNSPRFSCRNLAEPWTLQNSVSSFIRIQQMEIDLLVLLLSMTCHHLCLARFWQYYGKWQHNGMSGMWARWWIRSL